MSTTIETERTTPVGMTRLVTYGVLAAITASVVNAIIRFLAVSLFDVPTGFGPFAWGPVITTTVVGALGATVVYGLLVRFSQQHDRLFLIIAGIVLVLSFVPLFAPPSFLTEAPESVLWSLAVMHVTTAGIVIGMLLRTRTIGNHDD